jgi:hypothetical protein
VNRDATTQSSLLALARTRRRQRAVAHASLHRGAPMPTLRASMGYVVSTACVSEAAADAPPGGHAMRVLGVAPAGGFAYVVEDVGADDAPLVYRLFLAGPRRGHLVPLHAWYEQAESVADITARLEALAPTLTPPPRMATEAFMLSTRIVGRRALQVVGQDLPIRKFALQLVVEPVSGLGPAGHTTVTAFLRPQASLLDVVGLPGGEALARVAFTGLPSGVGLPKQTVVLLR